MIGNNIEPYDGSNTVGPIAKDPFISPGRLKRGEG